MSAKAFGKTNGKAIKNSYEDYKYVDGEQTVRLVGGVLPRYVYWVKGTNNKDIPIECLGFDRELEKFTNVEKDVVQEYFPDKKCQWAYSMNCIDPKTGKVVILNLKKKLFEQISNAADDLGDPTDPDMGWDVVFKRTKTGPLPFNVSYDLNPLRCKKRALTPEERAAVEAAMPIDQKYPRSTVEEIRTLCEKIKAGLSSEDNPPDTATGEAINELSQ